MLKAFLLTCDERFDIYINSFLQAKSNHLFNEPAYFKLHSQSDNDCYAQLVRRDNKKVYATLAFHHTADGNYFSPGRGTFGGLSLNEELELFALEKFIQAVTLHVRNQGAQMMCIKCAPASHDNALFAIEFNILTRLGFRSFDSELNYSMHTDIRAFKDRIDYGNVKRIRKMKREGFICGRADVELLPAVHKLLAENRARQGVLVSMSLDQLRLMFSLFPEKMHLFAVYRNSTRQEMVAAAVCIEVSSSILYVLYWGDQEGMRSYSPVAMVAASIYAYCAEHGFNLMDIGISTLKGEPNHGLVNFKRNLGFTESTKIEMVWQNKLGKDVKL